MDTTRDHRLIVALDHDDPVKAQALVEQLGDRIGFYKIGLGSLNREGFSLIEFVRNQCCKRLFLDLKLFDIGSTVSRAVRTIAKLQPEFLTVHGDPHIIRAAIDGRQGPLPRILAVTILTSLNRHDLDESLYCSGTIADLAPLRAERAFAAGADGVICSPHEVGAIRALPTAAEKLLVTPGIRMKTDDVNDQKRVWTPGLTLAHGADYLVVGRPITRAGDPCEAARRMLNAMR